MSKLVVALALSAACASPALALSPDEATHSVRVSYADLDLTRAEGRETLDLRLRRASRAVCQVLNRRSLAEMYGARACARRARALARKDAALAAARAQYQLAQKGQNVVSR